MSFVRSSKFRHVFGKENKNIYHGITAEGSGDTNCSVNAKHIAIIKMGKIYVLPTDKPGRYEDNSTSYIDACTKLILDVAWNPFNENQIACSTEDPNIKLFTIPPEGMSDDIKREPDVTLSKHHDKKITNIYWHPSAENILASISHDPLVVIWNLNTCTAITVIDETVFDDIPYCLAWNHDGSTIATTSKDRTLRLLDPRTGEVISKRDDCHMGARSSKVVFINGDQIVTCGSDKSSERQMRLWDQHDLSEPKFELELGRSAGVLMPYYDPDLDIIYTFCKGESTIKYYEVTNGELFFLSQFQTNEPQRGGNFIPKHAVDVSTQEITRFYKLYGNKIKPVSFIVPRKNEKKFQHDLYPNCAGKEPALRADDWISGKNSDPVKIDLSKKNEGRKSQPEAQIQVTHTQQPVRTATREPAAPKNGLAEGIDLEELLEDMKKVKATVRKLVKRVNKLEQQLEGVEEDGQHQEEEEEEE